MPLLTRTKKDEAGQAAPTEKSTVPAAARNSTPIRQRRRPALIAAGIALVVVCALGAWWLTERLSTTTQVVAVAQSVPEGQVLTADDLITADVNVPSGAAVVPGGDLDSLVGQRTTGTLEKGELLSPGSISAQAFPAKGAAVVGIKVGAGQIPSRDVTPGTSIKIVGTPREGDDPPSGDAPVITGKVQALGDTTRDGATTVDVLVSEDQAATLASLSATGRISVVVVPEEK